MADFEEKLKEKKKGERKIWATRGEDSIILDTGFLGSENNYVSTYVEYSTLTFLVLDLPKL